MGQAHETSHSNELTVPVERVLSAAIEIAKKKRKHTERKRAAAQQTWLRGRAST